MNVIRGILSLAVVVTSASCGEPCHEYPVDGYTGDVVVRWEREISLDRRLEIHGGIGAEILFESLMPPPKDIVDLPECVSVWDAVDYYEAQEEVRYAIPDTILNPAADDGV